MQRHLARPLPDWEGHVNWGALSMSHAQEVRRRPSTTAEARELPDPPRFLQAGAGPNQIGM